MRRRESATAGVKPFGSWRIESGHAWWCMRGAVMASASDMRWSTTLRITCAVPVMIVGPPAAPTTSSTWPEGSRTIVGDIELRGRLPGATAFCSPSTRPNAFGLPGATARSSISSFMKKPAPGM